MRTTGIRGIPEDCTNDYGRDWEWVDRVSQVNRICANPFRSPLLSFRRTPPDGMPRAVWRALGTLRLVTIGLAVAMCFAMVIVWYGVYTRRSVFSPWLWLLPVGLVLSGCIIPLLMNRRFCHYVERSEHRVCTHCGYCLAGLPERHKCPECGCTFEIEHVRSEWQAWVAKSCGSVPGSPLRK